MNKIILSEQQKLFLEFLNNDDFLMTYFKPFYAEGLYDGRVYIVCTFSKNGEGIINDGRGKCFYCGLLPVKEEDYINLFSSIFELAIEVVNYYMVEEVLER